MALNEIINIYLEHLYSCSGLLKGQPGGQRTFFLPQNVFIFDSDSHQCIILENL